MIVYSEKKYDNQSVYFKYILDDNGVELSKRIIHVPLFKVIKGKIEYYILYSSQMEVITEAFAYLNFTLYDSPLTTKAQKAYALRLLFCFLELNNCKIDALSEISLNELKSFLRGVGIQFGPYSLVTQRKAKTINNYLATYRSFFVSQNIQCEALFRKDNSFIGFEDRENLPSCEKIKFSNNLKTNTGRDIVPKYISPDEFRRIYKLVLEKEDTTAKIILHLMYGYGLRLGEVLGLTLEDVTEKKVRNNLVPILILRNRISDDTFQFSKGLLHVLSQRQYQTKDYINSCTEIIISYDLYEELNEYIEKYHLYYNKKYPQNYLLTQADLVTTSSEININHYIFLNQYGKVLSGQTWTNNLKKYFTSIGLHIDTEVKENNLSHRFRHGFAMFHARYSEKRADYLELQKLLRHRNITSVMKYYNPTYEDEFEIKTSFNNEIYNLIPELKRKDKNNV